MISQPAASERPTKRGRLWLLGLVAASAIAAGIVCWLRWPTASSKDVSDAGTTPRDKREIGGPSFFNDVAGPSGLAFTYHNGEEADQFTLLETLGGGVALLDYDGDGLLDIFVTGGGYFDGPQKDQIKGHPCKLYKNLGKWRFKDVTEEVGLGATAWWYTHGAAVADFDCDGWPDLLVTGYGRVALFHNEPDGKGGRRFVDVTDKVGLKDPLWSTSAAWVDIDGDGFPDLYVCHYGDWSFANNRPCKGSFLGVKRDVCGPGSSKPLKHSLFINDKGKSFRDAADEHGFKAVGHGLGVVALDLNGDGRPDIYVANDMDNNLLFLNRGGGKLEERGLRAGAAVDREGKADGSMGVDAADYDGSGRPSLWVTVFLRPHALYANLGRELFDHRSRTAGTAALGNQWIGFGTSFIDFDNDGWEDLAIVNGHVWRYPVEGTPKQRAVLMRNVEKGGIRFFEDFSESGGPFFQTPALGRGLAVGDLDNDGWPDIVVSHSNSPVALLRNEAAKSMPGVHRWLGVKLVGRDHRDVVGSTVTLEVGSRKLSRFSKSGGYLSTSDPRILFGLGAEPKCGRLTVRWAWGAEQHWDNLEPNCYWELREGEKSGRRLP